MIIKFITKWIRHLGMFMIFTLAALCIVGSIIIQDIGPGSLLSTALNYTIAFESRFYDFRMRNEIKDKKFKSEEQVLVNIDDYSLQQIGTYPLPRSLYADMLKKLQKWGTKVVAFDIMFPEKSPIQQNDKIFVDAIKEFQGAGGRTFIAYTLTTAKAESLDEAPVEMLNDAVDSKTNSQGSDLGQWLISKYTFPIQDIVATETGLAFIVSGEDTDGIFRNIQTVANIDTIYYGSLGWNAYNAYTGDKLTLEISGDSSAEVKIKGKKLDINWYGETKIRFIGADKHTFTDISFYDLLKAKDDDPKMKKIFDGKIVFVGSSALGAHDLRPSPVDPKMPGVYAHMNFVNMLLHQYFFRPANESVKYSLIFLLFIMILFYFVQRRGNAFLDMIYVIAAITAVYYADKLYFMPDGYELKLFYCFFCLVASYSWNTFLLFYEANKEKKQIKGTFARYVAPTIVDEMLKDPDKLHVGGVKTDITCLFSDVRDFTKISEGLSATELSHSLNLYMGRMTDIVFDTKGTLDKYIGDAIVAIWGAPLQIGNHAQYAVEAAIQMITVLPEINEEFRKLGRPEFLVGIGLNSGECAVGNMGSDRIFSYTALGDNMNLGARLESLSKYYGAQIIISQMTLDRLDMTNIKVRPIDKVVVKGKTQAVPIYEVLHPHHHMTKDPECLAFYMRAHGLFLERRFQEAKEIFEQILMGNENDKSTKRYKELCLKLIANPELAAAEDFDVTKMTEK
jgi:adenylate cyclase